MKLLKRTAPSALTTRVLQFGEGNFLRGFVDWMLDRLNKENGGDYGVEVIMPLSNPKMNKLINDQDCLYHLYLRGLLDGQKVEETRIVECIKKCIDPFVHTDEFMSCALNPDLRFIVSNTTEAGIEYKPGQSPKDFCGTTFPGRLTIFLKKRFDAGLGGFIFFPCELIDRNGDKLKECILKYAADWGFGNAFADWINAENHFTNTLVDRIVTGYPRDNAEEMFKKFGCIDNITDTAEIFHLWVIEGDRSLAKEIPFADIGLNVLWTDDVTPYKKRKVRILNGAHTMMVPAAIQAGMNTVGEVMEDELLCSFMTDGIFNEIIPTLDLPEKQLSDFADAVIERFKNPFIQHCLSGIALNSVSKVKVRVLPSLLSYIKLTGNEPKRLVFSLAALITLYKSSGASDNPDIMKFMRIASIKDILSKTEYWDTDLTFLLPSVEKYITDITDFGMRKALENLNENAEN